MPVIRTASSVETEAAGICLGKLLGQGDIICLNGDLGAGKTCFARGVARGLDIDEHITSPTFTLINEYQGLVPFYHFDVYRLAGPEDMEDLGFEDYSYGSGVTLIEWAALVEEVLRSERLDIWLSVDEEQMERREIRLVPQGDRYRRLTEEMLKIVGSGN